MSDVDETPMTPRSTDSPHSTEEPAEARQPVAGAEQTPVHASGDTTDVEPTLPGAEPAPPTRAGEPATVAEAASPEGEASPSQDVPDGPKVVHRVVCGYQLGSLPAEWLRTWRCLEHVLAERELKVRATLAALEELPSDTDILVVPPELREVAREAARPGTPLLITPASAADGAFSELVSRLLAGADFTAERLDPPASASAPPAALEGAAR